MSHDKNPSSQTVSIRGHSSVTRTAAAYARRGAWSIDLFWAMALVYICIHEFTLSPSDLLGTLVPVIFGILFLWWFQVAIFQRTLGMWVWGIQFQLLPSGKKPQILKNFKYYMRGWFSKNATDHRPIIYPVQDSPLQGAKTLLALAISTFSLVGAVAFLYLTLWNHPELSPVKTLEHQAFTSHESLQDSSDWQALPFFYTLGIWPRRFPLDPSGLPILYTLPYQKGPPQVFIGKIEARWKMPYIKLTIEGPKTRTKGASVSLIQSCLQHSPFFKGLFKQGLKCLKLRHQTLHRHIEEIQSTLSHRPTWTVRWFEMKNPRIPSNEEARGVYLKAATPQKIIERFIVINSEGRHQAFILERPPTSEGNHASEIFLKSIRSLRVLPQLSTGQALADTQLQKIHINRPTGSLKNPIEFIRQLAGPQAILLSKISVQPHSVQPYYHLGGTALMMAEYAKRQSETKNQILPARLSQVLNEALAVSHPLVQTCLKYAKDIRADHPMTQKLEQMSLQISP